MEFPMTKAILIPGLACDAAVWREQLREWPVRWPVAVTDVATREDSIPAMASALLADHDGDLVLCGASMGGMIAMEAARQAPGRVRGLALLGTSARPEEPAMQLVREQAIAMFESGRAEEVLRANVMFAFDRQHPDLQALAERYIAIVMNVGADQLTRQNRAVIGRPDARLHLPAVRCPTLVVAGESDLLTPPDCAREIAELVPGAQLHLLPRCGHMLTMEQPGAVNALLLGWLESLAA
jgi:pimeloyl-ACP methyl ester carboxylesterase